LIFIGPVIIFYKTNNNKSKEVGGEFFILLLRTIAMTDWQQQQRWHDCVKNAMMTLDFSHDATNNRKNSYGSSQTERNPNIDEADGIVTPAMIDGLLQPIFTICVSSDNQSTIGNDPDHGRPMKDTDATNSIDRSDTTMPTTAMMTDHNRHLIIQTLPARINMNHPYFSTEIYTKAIALYLQEQFQSFDEQRQENRKPENHQPNDGSDDFEKNRNKTKPTKMLTRHSTSEHEITSQSSSTSPSLSPGLCTILLDVRPGEGWSNPPVLSLIRFIKYCCHELHQLYPNRLNYCIVYPVPSIAHTIWSYMIKPFLPTSISSKIITIAGNADLNSPIPTKSLQNYVSVEAIERMEQNRIQSFMSS
jgi:CRAL/TRIO domain